MRKALLVIALIAASFAGGAVVNGHGLAWARKMVLGQGNDGYVALRGDDLVKSDPDPAKTRSDPPPDVPSAPPKPLDEIPSPRPPVDAPEAPKPEAPEKVDIPAPPDPPKTEAPTPSPVPARNDPAVSNASLAREAETQAPASDAPATWGDLRRRMKEMGVSRYWVEGEPGGQARFRCVIPVAGARAVAQHFEAEGDDDLQAADAALRRVALWRATEP